MTKKSEKVMPDGPVYSVRPLNNGDRYAWAVWPSREAAESVFDETIEWTPPTAAGEEPTRDAAVRAAASVAPAARGIAAEYVLRYPSVERSELRERARSRLLFYGPQEIEKVLRKDDLRGDLPKIVEGMKLVSSEGRAAIIELIRSLHKEHTGEDLVLAASPKPVPAPPPSAPRVRTVIPFAEVQERARRKKEG